MIRLRRCAIAVAVISVLALTGCTFPGLLDEPEPERQVEDVAAELLPFYGQDVDWSPCASDMECADIDAPLNWDDPAQDSISLALIRHRADGRSLGSVLVNPGGPGGSGVDYVRDSVDFATSQRLQKNYDIVGFDPRGVGASSAVSCYDDPDDFTDFLYEVSPYVPGSPEWIDDLEDSYADFGEDCAAYTGELLGFVDTVSAAHDLDLIRALLGDDKLNYLGYSYGTLLGATYAELYPEKTGHLVLDGAVDPTTSDFDVTSMQAQGFESAFRAYLEECLASNDECPFRGSVEQAMRDTRRLLESLDRNPIEAADGRELASGAMFTAIILPLYSESTWSYLDLLFDDVVGGSAEIAFRLADSYNGRAPDGSYLDNSTEAFIAINCLDYAQTSTRESLATEAEELAELAPVFGPQMSYGGTSCEQWPYPSTRERVAIAAEGSAPILVVGTSNDPATPYAWAVALAGQLENGHLISYEGEGHTAYNKSNSCVDDAVDDFFIDDVVPESDPEC